MYVCLLVLCHGDYLKGKLFYAMIQSLVGTLASHNSDCVAMIHTMLLWYTRRWSKEVSQQKHLILSPHYNSNCFPFLDPWLPLTPSSWGSKLSHLWGDVAGTILLVDSLWENIALLETLHMILTLMWLQMLLL